MDVYFEQIKKPPLPMPSKGGWGRFSLIITKINFANCSFPNIYIHIYIYIKTKFQEKLIHCMNTVFNLIGIYYLFLLNKI